jgi:hypothetical protein
MRMFERGDRIFAHKSDGVQEWRKFHNDQINEGEMKGALGIYERELV